MDYSASFQGYLARIEQGIATYLPDRKTQPARLHEAMHYSMEAGGKRLRPMLALAACELAGDENDALPAAVALECVHTYSLVHDDLPCMDNDDLRRGRPTAHKAFDEATALLAGDALLTHAFVILGTAYPEEPVLTASLVRELSHAAGSLRLIGGQMADLQAEKNPNISAKDLEFIHSNKTGAMIEASLVMGGLCGGTNPEKTEVLRAFGRHLGLAFQIVDDLLDVTSDSATLGKTVGKDLKADKTTYIKIHGMEAARDRAHAETASAINLLARFGTKGEFLETLTRKLETRVK